MRFKYLIFFGALFIVIACNYRTPSKERFENNTDINLPNSIVVIEDRFEESGPDYGLFYEFQTDATNCLEILEYLKESNDWKKIGKEFRKTQDGIIYFISITTNENKVVYREELI